MITLVLFDLDGVLVDACEWHYLSLNKALYQICGFTISRELHIKEFNGLPTKTKLNKLCNQGLINSKDIDQISLLKQQFTKDIIEQHNSIDYNKRRLLDLLHLSNIKIGCVTNSIRETAEMMLNANGLLDHIDLVVSNEDVKINKPNAYPYKYAMKYFNILPINTLIVEDSDIGWESAINSRAHCLRVSGPDDVTIDNIFQKIREIEGT